jgi:hypothetical protein
MDRRWSPIERISAHQASQGKLLAGQSNMVGMASMEHFQLLVHNSSNHTNEFRRCGTARPLLNVTMCVKLMTVREN